MDLKCWCGGIMQVSQFHGNHPDLEESFQYEVMECGNCYVQKQTDEQIEAAKATIAEALASEEARDFDKEASEYVLRKLNAGMLVPRRFEDLPIRELERAIEHHDFRHIFVDIPEGSVRIYMQDYMDALSVTLDDKQEAELLVLLKERANVTIMSQ